MAYEFTPDMVSQAPHAAVVYTGRHQQTPGQCHRFRCVQSRFFLRCLGGEGEAVVNDTTLSLRAGSAFFAPWNHRYAIESSRKNPLLVVGLHIIPDYQPPHDYIYLSCHDPDNPLADDHHRKDVPLDALNGVVQFRLQDEAPIHDLGDYILHWFHSGRRQTWQSRQLAQLMLQALVDLHKYKPKSVPMQLRMVIEQFYRTIDHPWTIPELASLANVSTATLHRLFKQYLEVAPAVWMQETRIKQAAHLVVSTKLAFGEIGRRVGIPDPYYFSKQFQRFTGETARQYRKGRGQLPTIPPEMV